MNTNKRATESFIVVAPTKTTLQNSAGSFTTLQNTNGNINLDEGEIAIVSDSKRGSSVAFGGLTDATPTITEAPVIRIYQGTADSKSWATASATAPLWVRPYERTQAIDGTNGNLVTITKQPYRLPSHSIWLLGNTDGTASAVNVADDTTYGVTIAFRGRRVEEFFSEQQAAYYESSITTPNFTDLGHGTTAARSWILHQIAYDVNRNSQALNVFPKFTAKIPVVALLIASEGGAGTEIGGSTPIAAGDSIGVVNTSTGVRSITLTDAMATAIKNVATSVTGDVIADVTWTILTIDLSTAYSVSSAEADMIMFVALDEKLAYDDRIPQVKVRLEVGLKEGFDFQTVRNSEVGFPDEGQGEGRVLDLMYKATQGQRKYNLDNRHYPVINFPSPVSTTGQYTVYNILHGRTEQVGFNAIFSPFREIICIPRYSSGTTAHAVIGTLDTALNAWLASANMGTVKTLD